MNGQHLLVRVQVAVKSFSHKGANARFARLTCKICGTVRKEDRHPQPKDQLHVPIDTQTTGRATHTREIRIVLIVELTLILFRARSSPLSRQLRSASSNRNEELADRVSRDDDHETTN